MNCLTVADAFAPKRVLSDVRLQYVQRLSAFFFFFPFTMHIFIFSIYNADMRPQKSCRACIKQAGLTGYHSPNLDCTPTPPRQLYDSII